MVGQITVVWLVTDSAVTFCLYGAIHKYKIYQLAPLQRNASEVMKAPHRSVSNLCHNASVLHSAFRQYNDRLGIHRSIKVSGNNYRKVSRHCLLYTSDAADE